MAARMAAKAAPSLPRHLSTSSSSAGAKKEGKWKHLKATVYSRAHWLVGHSCTFYVFLSLLRLPKSLMVSIIVFIFLHIQPFSHVLRDFTPRFVRRSVRPSVNPFISHFIFWIWDFGFIVLTQMIWWFQLRPLPTRTRLGLPCIRPCFKSFYCIFSHSKSFLVIM